MRTFKEKNSKEGPRRRKVDPPGTENNHELRNDPEFRSDLHKGDSSNNYRSSVPVNEEISLVQNSQGRNPHPEILRKTEKSAQIFSKEKLLNI